MEEKIEEHVQLILHGLQIFDSFVASEKRTALLISQKYNEDPHCDLKFVLTGSFAEGFPDVVFSDIDWMIIVNAKEALTPKWHNMLFKPLPEAPAHLQIVIHQEQMSAFSKDFPDISGTLGLTDTDESTGNCFLSAEKLRSLNQKDFLPDDYSGEKLSKKWDSNENKSISPSYELRSVQHAWITCDRVPALICNGWPKSAGEWLLRKPRYWPTVDTLNKILSMGYAVVAKPASEAGETKKEWRFSFSFAERELLTCLPEKQRVVYYFLRSIYVRYLKPVLKGGMLTSYHIKTSMFWLLEESPQSFWQRLSISEAVVVAFSKLLAFLRTKNCPHYFLPHHNLFFKASKEEFEVATDRIERVTSDILGVLISVCDGGYLGLIPRFCFQTIESRCRLNKYILELPQEEAHFMFTSTEPETVEQLKNFDMACMRGVLSDSIVSLQMRLDSVTFLEIALPLVVVGYHTVLATDMNGSSPSYDRSKASHVDRSFVEITVNDMNKVLVYWMIIFKEALAKKEISIFFGYVNNLLPLLEAFPNDLRENKEVGESGNTSKPSIELVLLYKLCQEAARRMKLDSDSNASTATVSDLMVVINELHVEPFKYDEFAERTLYYLVGGTCFFLQ